MNLYRAIQTRLLTFTRMVFARWPRSRAFFGGGMRGERSYEAEVGDGRGSALLMACISWVVNSFTAMEPAVVELRDDDMTTERVQGHIVTRLFRRPTYDPATRRSFYSWMTMIAGVLVSFIVDGNAYLLKIRGAGGSGRPVQLWYVPHWMMTPVWDPENPGQFIAYYDYCPDGQTHYRVEVQDVIHLRDGIDPDNTRKGLSKTKVLLREIMTDEQAASWTVSLLINHAVPGLVVVPDLPLESLEDALKMKSYVQEQFTGDRRGMPAVLGGPSKLLSYGFSPEQMKLGDIRDIPEERVSMAVGIPAAVVGMGAGLQSTKVGATMAELVDLAWQNGVMPRAHMIEAEITEQLLTEFESGAAENIKFIFDTSSVPIMADYHLKVAQRHEILMKSGIETRGRAQRAVGLPSSSEDDVYVLQAGMTIVKPTGEPVWEKPEPRPALTASNGPPALGPGPAPVAPAAKAAFVMKPIGPFPDFAACVRHMQSDAGGSHSEESAKRICGAMEAEMSKITERTMTVEKTVLTNLILDPNKSNLAVVTYALAQRDGWECKLCNQPIDTSLNWPDPNSPSIDHIVPLSFGGPNGMDNLRLAHFGCNSRRGNEKSRHRIGAAARHAAIAERLEHGDVQKAIAAEFGVSERTVARVAAAMRQA